MKLVQNYDSDHAYKENVYKSTEPVNNIEYLQHAGLF